MVRKIDIQERELIRQLIRNPRISDNQISKNTNIPLKTVNRKRKKLENEGLLNYFTYLDTSEAGTGDFSSRHLFIVRFKHGITREIFHKSLNLKDMSFYLIKHVLECQLGEVNGRLSLILMIESRKESDIVEIFNAEIAPYIYKRIGGDAIHKVDDIRISEYLSFLHNYSPKANMRKGIIKEEFPDSSIFVTDQEFIKNGN